MKIQRIVLIQLNRYWYTFLVSIDKITKNIIYVTSYIYQSLSFFPLIALSRFYFTIPHSNCQTTHEQKLSDKEKKIVAETDEDGDILVRRLHQNEIEQNVITIGIFKL